MVVVVVVVVVVVFVVFVVVVVVVVVVAMVLSDGVTPMLQHRFIYELSSKVDIPGTK